MMLEGVRRWSSDTGLAACGNGFDGETDVRGHKLEGPLFRLLRQLHFSVNSMMSSTAIPAYKICSPLYAVVQPCSQSHVYVGCRLSHCPSSRPTVEPLECNCCGPMWEKGGGRLPRKEKL